MKKLSLILAIFCTGLAVAQAPPNDTCQTAITLAAPGIYAGTNVGGSASIFGVGTCGLTGTDVWYKYTAQGNGNKLIASTCNPGSSSFSTGVDIFTGTCLGPPATAGCNATHCDTGGIVGGRAHVVTVLGTTYLIRVRGTSTGTTGTFNLYLDELPIAAPNGTCATPTPISDGINGGLSNFLEPAALAAGFTPCGSAAKDVFFTYLASGTGNTTIRTCFPAPTSVPAVKLRDSIIAVYASCSGGTPLACNDNGCGGVAGTGASLSAVTFPSSAGITYIIQVCGAGSGATAAEGIFDLEVIPPPANDECTGALPIALGTNPAPAASGFTYSMNSASVSAGWANPPACIFTTVSADLWYTFTPATSGLYQIDTEVPTGFVAGALADTTLELYANTGCGIAPSLACDDDSGVTGSGLLSLIVANLTAGSTYYMRVGDYGPFTGGGFYLNLTFLGPPVSNDECSGATIIGIGSNGPFSNGLATNSFGYNPSCGTGSNDVFFLHTATCGAPSTISTGCNGSDVILTVYPACGGAELACNDNDPSGTCGLSSVVNLNFTAGTTYLIRVASWSTSPTSFNVDITSGFGLNWVSPLGPGTVQFSMCNGDPNGTYYMFVTLAAGGFPNGWFYGIDITLAEIANQVGFGFPFSGPLNGAGDFISPIFGGVPSGLTIYSVAFSVPPGGASPNSNSGAKSFTTP